MIHIQDRVADALGALGVDAGDRVGVACSGGPDSAVLAHVALHLCRRGRLGPVTLLYVDHGLRPDSRQDGEVVADLARRWGGAVAHLAVTVDRARASLEAAARDARYAALAQAAADLALRWVLLAHTASDQSETVFMRIVRGTGVTGLGAIPPARDDIYLRPLLGTTRAEIEQYRAAFEVPAVADPMNRDPAFLRNRVRHRWLPALREENPRIDEALCRLAEAARAQGAVLDYAATQLLARAARGRGQAAGALDVRVLVHAPDAVVTRALALAAEGAGAGPMGARHRQALHALVQRPRAGTVSIELPGLTAVREYDVLRLHARAAGAPGAAKGLERGSSGVTSAAAGFPANSLGQGVPGEAGDEVSGEVSVGAAERAPDAAAPNAAASRAEADRLQVMGPDGPYGVRRWQPGDRMRPARLRGRSRKLGDLFIDARIPRAQRAQALVVTRLSDGVIEWAEHIGPAYRSRVSVSLTMPEPVASNKVSD